MKGGEDRDRLGQRVGSDQEIEGLDRRASPAEIPPELSRLFPQRRGCSSR
jgi:hypothetical protein